MALYHMTGISANVILKEKRLKRAHGFSPQSAGKAGAQGRGMAKQSCSPHSSPRKQKERERAREEVGGGPDMDSKATLIKSAHQ